MHGRRMVKFLFLYFFNVYLFLRERERERETEREWGGAEREGDTESEAGSRLQAVSPRARRGARTHEPRDHDLS